MSRLIMVSGPSGCGKTTIMRQVMSNEIVSFTTREKREGEVDGVDYLFITDDLFNKLLKAGGLAEFTDYYGTAKYGLTLHEINSKLSKGDAFVIVDYVGMQQLKTLYPNSISIFIFTQPEIAAQRMRKRGDKPERVEQRLRTFEKELENMKHYDLIVENADGQILDSIKAVSDFIRGESGVK